MICGARFILVVEKDAVFQKLLSENFYGTFKPCLLITAKGYPDLRTRCLLSLINRQHPSLPILGLFDADPHGLGVFCTYKYGTRNPTMKGTDLRPVKIGQMKLIGLLPTELMSFQLQKSELIALNKSDRALLYGIQKRWYFKGDPDLVTQTKALLDCGFKAEIEVLDHISPQFLCQEYLSLKLRSMGIFPLE
ncbi:hypothetical protein CRM22_010465 [Opisthorchis felineus]|uniref:Topoisomerase 6 subunit A/Spo11 TOPRIM domain-containing protein n=1 Tax=Opisthorchis felineus TaxID=147828 RepID=A0A4S2L445_OPIFE|nr:hypothetical protein CRM22_010465 [Opisthorchis felineus]